MRDDILNNYWVSYLRYWNASVKDESKPPTKDGFWMWYATNVLVKEPDSVKLNIDLSGSD